MTLKSLAHDLKLAAKRLKRTDFGTIEYGEARDAFVRAKVRLYAKAVE